MSKPKAIDTVLWYHERTQHHPTRPARSLGHMDWSNQPDPWRRFEGARTIDLPLQGTEDGGGPAFHRLSEFDKREPMNLESISAFLGRSLAIST